jgi:hypothetical protein
LLDFRLYPWKTCTRREQSEKAQRPRDYGKEVGVHIRQTLYVLAKNMVEAMNKAGDQEDVLKISMATKFK